MEAIAGAWRSGASAREMRGGGGACGANGEALGDGAVTLAGGNG